MQLSKKVKSKCLVCEKETARVSYTYCSNKCQLEYQYLTYIKKWKAEKTSGLLAIGVVSAHVKKYLRRKFGNKCYLCGWCQLNQKSGRVPLVADHIDGNWRNNIERNLRLICPNCDSLSSTYAALNKGNGRRNRRISNRNKEAHLIARNTKNDSKK